MESNKQLRLSGKQSVFVAEFLIDQNATHAALKAGYSKKTAYRMGSENLHKPHIAAAIAAALEKRSTKVGVKASDVLVQLDEMRLADYADLLSDEGSYKPVAEWPLIWRQMISAMETKEQFDKEGTKTGEVVKIKFVDRSKVIEMTGKHVDVQSWIERAEVTHLEGRSQRLADASRRVIDLEKTSDGTYQPEVIKDGTA